MAIEPPLDDYKRFPKMAHWFSPWLLIRLLNNVITSSMFGKYADRRLIVAALDTVDAPEHMRRAASMKSAFTPDERRAVWLDFVADLGDGFDSTFAVASLLARKQLELSGEKLSRGQTLIMGGDEVYPAANEKAYRNQLWQPYNWAFPDHDKKANNGVPVFAIPGNHDWYDGLVLFLAYFCREKPFHLGSWRSRQRRSYFAFQVTETWWVWATDIQLADNMDQPQADYFKIVAARMNENSKIILCSAEPGWLYTDTNNKSWSIMDYALGIASEANKGHSIPILISGDTHHYSRYAAEDGTQFVTSGGGGAFLHPTHQLEEEIKLKWIGKDRTLKLGRRGGEPAETAKEAACYPSMQVSQRLNLRNVLFAFENWDFSLLMGVVYWLVGVAVGVRDHLDIYLIVALIFGASIIGYTVKQEQPKLTDEKYAKAKRTEKERRQAQLVLGSSALHAASHICLALWWASAVAEWNDANLIFQDRWFGVWIWLGALLVQMGTVGVLVGSTIFGLNLLITCRWLRMNRNDAFSAFRLGGYNNFLRLRIVDEQLEVFAIGLDNVPERDGWKSNPSSNPLHGGQRDPDKPIFVPITDLQPHLIERFVVRQVPVSPMDA